MAVRINDKQALINWEEFRQSIRKHTPVDFSESSAEQKKRMAALEADPQAWKEYYFPKYHKYPSPAFHKKATLRLIKNFTAKKHWYEVRHWVRGLAKTTLTMMDVLYLVMTGKLKNIIYTSSSYDIAEGFLEKYRAELDSNQRLIHDYGKQELAGSWEAGNFKTRKGTQFTAVGAGQNPRGKGNDEIRPDCIIVDDFDTDEECRNPDIINKKWDWFEKALFFTVDTAQPYLIMWLGNIIAEDCCVVRAGDKADYREVINIRDDKGKSVWPEKNSEEDIDYQLSKVSWESGQQEFFNNPLRQGQTFKEITWGAVPKLSDMKLMVQYGDPATSNKDKPAARSKAQNSCKVVAVLGYHNLKYYLVKCYVDNTTNSNFIDWLYANHAEIGSAAPLYSFIENNTLQDPFFEQVLMPLVHTKGKEKGQVLPITPDTRKKPEKWFRIEATLEPLVRLGQLIFNEAEKNNPHMQRMASQFLTASPNSRELGGPDAIEGAVKILQDKIAVQAMGEVQFIKRKTNQKRF